MKRSLQARFHSLKKRFGIKNHAPAITNQKRIMLYLHQLEPMNASWVIMTDHSEIQQTILHGDLAMLTAIAKQYEIHVIIPGQDVLLTHAELPKLSRERLLQALPYAVEDKLIDDISKLHFAIGKFAPLGTPVAIISKETMATCLSHLNQAGITPQTMIPATLALPWTEHNWYAFCDDNIGIVRTHPFLGFACDKENLSALLQLQLLETPYKPTCIHLENVTQLPLNLALDPILVNETLLSETHFLEKIALLLGANPYINLLQGSFRPKRKSNQTKKTWIIAAALAGTWIIAALLSNAISFFILHNSKNNTDREIAHIYHEQFPAATSVVAPRERMESALKKASAIANQNNFLTLLGFVGDDLHQNPNLHIQSLNFQDDRMNLAVTANSFQTLDHFTQTLTKEGFNVKQQNAAVNGSDIIANILISKGNL